MLYLIKHATFLKVSVYYENKSLIWPNQKFVKFIEICLVSAKNNWKCGKQELKNLVPRVFYLY